MLAELNKIAIVHLFLNGFEEEIGNFTLGLTNPSTQADLLKIDVWKEKVLLYKDAVSDPGNGIQPVSSTWAKKHILGFSDDEIKLDLQQQRIEKAVGEELKNTPAVIQKTGIFNNIDKLYGSVTGSTATAGATPEGEVTEPTELPPTEALPAETAPPETPPTEEPAGAEAGTVPESRFENMNILIDSDMIKGKTILDLSQGQQFLGEIEKELDNLLNS